jgi:hypothetical protein
MDVVSIYGLHAVDKRYELLHRTVHSQKRSQNWRSMTNALSPIRIVIKYVITRSRASQPPAHTTRANPSCLPKHKMPTNQKIMISGSNALHYN